jgi:hypothetical protein
MLTVSGSASSPEQQQECGSIPAMDDSDLALLAFEHAGVEANTPGDFSR